MVLMEAVNCLELELVEDMVLMEAVKLQEQEEEWQSAEVPKWQGTEGVSLMFLQHYHLRNSKLYM